MKQKNNSSVGRLMKAAIVTKYGPPEVVRIEDRPKPVPKDNKILVRICATTVTSGDCRVRGANVPPIYKPMLWVMFGVGKPRQPVLGTEFTGQVEEVGDKVKAFKRGDAVFGTMGMLNLGAHAEYALVPERGGVVLKPEGISFEQAAALAFGGTTALHFLRTGKLQKGQRILIYGASGAVGTSAVQLAKHLGAEVTGVCSGANLDLVGDLGADKVIDYTREDLRATNLKYDVVFDAVGRMAKPIAKEVLTQGGVFLSVMAGFVGVRQEDLRLLGELTAGGKYSPVIGRTYPFEQIADAHAYVETGHKRGNAVVIMPT